MQGEEEPGAKAAVGNTPTSADGGYPGTGIVMPHRRDLALSDGRSGSHSAPPRPRRFQDHRGTSLTLDRPLRLRSNDLAIRGVHGRHETRHRLREGLRLLKVTEVPAVLQDQ